MCGIAGFLEAGAATPGDELERRVQLMAATLRHRGPDSAGSWVDERCGLAFGHTRLAILDLSPTGAQPMLSPSGRYVLVYNGELYNHRELRAELGGSFRGSSDTETWLAAIEAWGLEETLRRSNGMFALALWDRTERQLTLARDRAGEKPLYYFHRSGVLAFASELKALRTLATFPEALDPERLSEYLRFGYVPEPGTIHAEVFKLRPGHLLIWPDERPYWQPGSAGRPEQLEAKEWVDRAEGVLKAAVGARMLADVPLGAFLSGGIDSSTVVALMQAQSAQPVRTFTIGCSAWPYDEAPHARAVARHLGTRHTELDVTPADARAVIPQLATLYDEPFADESQIPTFLVAQLARTQVTVCLSGDGADELFGGYNRYLWGSRVWARLAPVPWVLRRALGSVLRWLSPAAWDRLLRGLPLTTPGQKLYKLAGVLDVQSPEQLYQRLTSLWLRPHELLVAPVRPTPPPRLRGDLTEAMMAADFSTYLPGDILTKVDRATMGVSLEARVPYLDPRVIELARSMPADVKIRAGETKWVLRQVLQRYLPPRLSERPKMGFSVPLADWLRGPLRPWADDLLSESRLRGQGLLDPRRVRREWSRLLGGRSDGERRLWTVLMLQSWLDSSCRVRRHPANRE